MQLETPVKATKQQQSQLMVVDLCGRLYGEIEDILHTLGVKIDAKYSKYTYLHNASAPSKPRDYFARHLSDLQPEEERLVKLQ